MRLAAPSRAMRPSALWITLPACPRPALASRETEVDDDHCARTDGQDAEASGDDARGVRIPAREPAAGAGGRSSARDDPRDDQTPADRVAPGAVLGAVGTGRPGDRSRAG